MIESDSVISFTPDLEPEPIPFAESPVRRFFRDIDSSRNFEDGLEFHAAGVVIAASPESEGDLPEITVLYVNPFTAKVEKRSRSLAEVILYEFPQDDGVYWQLWEQTYSKLEMLLSKQ